MKTFVIGSRGSKLALWQARWVEAHLCEAGFDTRIEVIKTTGDKITDVTLAQVGAAAGGKGVFTKEIEDALLEGSIDLAVHSLKDLPTELPAGLALAAVPRREDPRDALVGFKLRHLPDAARVGTSSLRRSAQLRALRHDLDIRDMRGNVDTRLRKLDEGEYDAILLACAGLRRLGLKDRITEALDPTMLAPAVGQGALGIETRANDRETMDAVTKLEHAETRSAVEAERALLDALGGGCQVPLGAYAHAEKEELHLMATVVAPDGSRIIRAEQRGSIADPAALGKRTAETLLADGAGEIIAAAAHAG